MVFNDGSEIDMLVTQDILPEWIRERGAVSLGIEAADGILWVKVVDCFEHTGFMLSAEVGAASPRGFPTTHTPVPGVMWVMDVIVVAGSLRDNLVSIIIIVLEASQV